MTEAETKTRQRKVYHPWNLAKESEHSQQRAVFAWLNCAAMHGFAYADDPNGYTIAGRASMAGLGVPALPVPGLRYAFAIHNQGHGDAIRGNRAKAEGVKAGAPDLMVPIPRRQERGLFVELKTEDRRPKRGGAGGVADVQNDYHEFLRAQGYAVVVAYGWQEAVAAIRDYLVRW